MDPQVSSLALLSTEVYLCIGSMEAGMEPMSIEQLEAWVDRGWTGTRMDLEFEIWGKVQSQGVQVKFWSLSLVGKA